VIYILVLKILPQSGKVSRIICIGVPLLKQYAKVICFNRLSRFVREDVCIRVVYVSLWVFCIQVR
jgi:hypothetical protein